MTLSDAERQLAAWAQEHYDNERYYAALPLFRALVALRQEAFGYEDEMTQSAMHQVVYTLHFLRRYSDAVPVCRELLAIRERCFGLGDRRTQDAKGWLDALLHEAPRFS